MKTNQFILMFFHCALIFIFVAEIKSANDENECM